MAEAQRLDATGIAVATYGVAGVLALLARAMWRLTPPALEPIEQHMLTGSTWVLYITWTLFNLYAEGYRGFQKAFSPRVVARAIHLAHNRKPLHVLLAPVFCMALFHAKRKNLIMSWALVVVIVALVILVRMLAQPWRGIIDAGVVVGLAWGAASIVILFFRAVVGGIVPEHDSLPDDEAAAVSAADRTGA